MGGLLSALFGSDDAPSGGAARGGGGGGRREHAQVFRDKYETLEQVTQALREAGLESSQLVIGIDCTKSNTWTGAKTFGGRCLHALDTGGPNPYEETLSVIGRTLAPFDDDGLWPVYGFGDARTTDKAVFSFADGPCRGVEGALAAYRAAIPHVQLAGPTSFAPLIRRVCEQVRAKREFTILLIITDGAVTNVKDTEDAIVEASSLPIEIIVVGVGDGPWDAMEEFDDALPARRFDNLQFVCWSNLRGVADAAHRETAFAVAALQEVPDAFKSVVRLKLL